VPSIRRVLVSAALLLASAGAAGAESSEPALGQVRLAATSRIYVTLVPRSADEDEGTRWLEGGSTIRPALNLSLRTMRRNRLAFAMTHRDVLFEGDQLQLRLASDAHIVAQLLSGGAFSDADDSWIAVLGLASRFRLSYTSGPWQLSVSARHKFGDGDVKARLTYGFTF
jgi:hypothetical protein